MLSVACGGDDSGSTPTTTPDAGTKSGSSMDGGSKNGGMTMIPRRDAQVANTEDPITACGLDNPDVCASGEVCDLLIRQQGAQFGFYHGCVKETPERREGDPCDPEIMNTTPYETEGLNDLVYRDPCGAGLVCAPNRKVRGAWSCQPECSSGTNAPPFACADATALCLGTSTGYSEYCRKSDGCNVEKQTGCVGNEACYLIPSDNSKQLLAFCSGVPDKPTPDNMPCESIVGCKPGSVCLGPVRSPISAWMSTDLMCRPVCNGEKGTAPAQMDEDAGLPSGLCSETTRCVPYSESGLVLSSISTPPFGQCEAQ